jgi:type VI secretion system protein ImpH
MASPSGPPDSGLIGQPDERNAADDLRPAPPPGAATLLRRLEEEPFNFEFFQLVRLLERMVPDRGPVGRFTPPKQEVARFKANPQTAFPASEIQKLEFNEAGQAEVTINFLGLTGPQGLLPLYYSEYIRERLRQRDSTPAAFFDLFNHRMVSLFFQAWEKYRFPIAYERGDRDRFSHILHDLVGMGTEGLLSRSPIHDDALIFYSGLLSDRTRHAAGLRNLIADYFDVPCEVDQFIGAWYPLSEESLCEFDQADSISEQLGVGAIVGDEVFDQQSAIRIILGPLSLSQYRDFLPDGSAYGSLQDLARFYAGPSMDFEVQLILDREEVPASHTGVKGQLPPEALPPILDEVQLGWTTWIKTRPRNEDAYDTVIRF